MSLDVTLSAVRRTTVFDYNITHNLAEMADKAGIYKHLWRPEELEITLAEQLIAPLQTALKDLEARPQYYKKYNPDNGWGSYEGFVKFVKEYLQACIENPDTEISVSR